MNGTIVGIDPGTTTGVCILDLDGKLKSLHSQKNLTLNNILDLISKKGDPVIIATDVNPAPDFVQKVAATFRTVLFTPDLNIPYLEKLKLTKNFLKEYEKTSLKNRHERAALAAAILAYNSRVRKLRQVERKMSESGVERVDEVKKLVLKGTSMHRAKEKLYKD